MPIYRDLDAAIELLKRLLKKYYGVLAGSDIDVVVSYLEDPLTIFRFAWIDAQTDLESRSAEPFP